MVVIKGDTAEELAEVQEYIIEGMLAKKEASFEGQFELSSGNLLVTDDSYWKRIIGEREEGSSGFCSTRYI